MQPKDPNSGKADLDTSNRPFDWPRSVMAGVVAGAILGVAGLAARSVSDAPRGFILLVAGALVGALINSIRPSLARLVLGGALLVSAAVISPWVLPDGQTAPPKRNPALGSASTTTTSTTTTTTLLPTTSSTLAGSDRSYRLDFGDKTHIDLDTGMANTNGGAQFEVRLSSSRFYTTEKYGGWKDTQVKYIPDSQARLDGCIRGTLIQQDVAHLSEVEQDETICVSTNEGRWATMKIVDGRVSRSGLGAAVITFDVNLF